MAPSLKRHGDEDTIADDPASNGGEPSSKRAKKNSAGFATANAVKAREGKHSVDTATQKDDNGDEYWELSSGGTRRVTVNEFKGVTMVNLREYYEKDGRQLPGKKGISLPVDQFAALVDVLPSIEKVLRERGQSIPRPHYEGGFGAAGVEEPAGGEADEVGEGNLDSKSEKKNFEATSDEDEG